MFLLLLMGLGAASVKAQVRIGGNTPPNPAAALDLNADDSATPAGNKGALALPRVSLSSTTAQLNGATPITGMLVYNTNTTLGVGIYFWSGSIWSKVDDAIGNELTDTIAGGGLTKTGLGTATDPWKVGIKKYGIDTSMISPGLPGLNTLFFWNNGAWRLGYMKSTLITISSPTPGLTQSTTVDITGCRTNPNLTVESGSPTVLVSWAFTSATTISVYSVTTTSGAYYITFSCWAVR